MAGIRALGRPARMRRDRGETSKKHDPPEGVNRVRAHALRGCPNRINARGNYTVFA